MTTHFITAEIDLNQNQEDLVETIKNTLSTQGEPLRWAVTEVDTNNQIATVEAVVTT
ncbi:hypothetical protein Syn7502_03450 [Synechococcus sp. PCC 7502]|uniref:hypothetical protein n=1 Tax=Synechococcus sp. PCC 7502 TaxID=1173263 RepID=UPI00029F91A8|nr:hypothetical protein [Synechococcus sp. PCC 7502]AFY75299.1 hypothetical protein Syn7502_03450 [Synechococcus sp. PCC 7502]